MRWRGILPDEVGRKLGLFFTPGYLASRVHLTAFYVSAAVKPHFSKSITPPQQTYETTPLAASYGVGHNVPRTTFYPCRFSIVRSPNAVFARRRSWKLLSAGSLR